MSNGDITEINIIYDIKKDIKRKKDFVNIFGYTFVEKNRKKCKLIIENKEYEITWHYNIKQYKNNILNIKLEGINNITDMSNMFYGCSALISLPDISKLNTNNVTSMNNMLEECSSLSTLPDISNWNTSNVTNMNGMFKGCSSLSSLPDISKWNVNNVTHMCHMFNGCSSLSSLPDISNGILIS